MGYSYWAALAPHPRGYPSGEVHPSGDAALGVTSQSSPRGQERASDAVEHMGAPLVAGDRNAEPVQASTSAVASPGEALTTENTAPK